MITVDDQSSGRTQNHDKGSQQANKNYKNRQQERRNGRNQNQSDGRSVTECGFCNLIKEKDVPQDYVQMNFDERHSVTGDKALWPNQCLPWMMLSIDERIRVIADSKIYCKYCLRLLTIGATSNTCGKGKHIAGNGRNGSCINSECENNVTMCKKNEGVNK